MSYVLYSSLEALSRSFVATENLAGYEAVDWPKGDRGDLVTKGISPSSFPSVAYLLPANVAMPELWVVISASSIAEAEATRDAMIVERAELAQELPPLPVKPDYLKFLYLLSVDQTLPLEIIPFLAIWKADPSGLLDDQQRYGFWAKMTGPNKAYFVTDSMIQTIQSYANLCNVQLTPPKE